MAPIFLLESFEWFYYPVATHGVYNSSQMSSYDDNIRRTMDFYQQKLEWSRSGRLAPLGIRMEKETAGKSSLLVLPLGSFIGGRTPPSVTYGEWEGVQGERSADDFTVGAVPSVLQADALYFNARSESVGSAKFPAIYPRIHAAENIGHMLVTATGANVPYHALMTDLIVD